MFFLVAGIKYKFWRKKIICELVYLHALFW